MSPTPTPMPSVSWVGPSPTPTPSGTPPIPPGICSETATVANIDTNFLGVNYETIVSTCPTLTCRTKGGLVTFPKKNGELKADGSAKTYLVFDGDTLIPMGNQVGAEFSRSTSGSLAISIDYQVLEEIVLGPNCANPKFTLGKIKLSFSGSGTFTTTYQVVGSAGVRWGFVSAGGSAMNQIAAPVTVSTPAAGFSEEIYQKLTIDLKDKTPNEVNVQIKEAILSVVPPLREIIIDETNEALANQNAFIWKEFTNSIVKKVLPAYDHLPVPGSFAMGF